MFKVSCLSASCLMFNVIFCCLARFLIHVVFCVSCAVCCVLRVVCCAVLRVVSCCAVLRCFCVVLCCLVLCVRVLRVRLRVAFWIVCVNIRA